jgi:phage shock protein E
MFDSLKKILGLKTTDYAQLMANGAIIIDVRSTGEFASGHIKGSINIPVTKLTHNLNKLKDKSKPIITCCASGARSASAKSILKSSGYVNTYNGGSWMSLRNKIN